MSTESRLGEIKDLTQVAEWRRSAYETALGARDHTIREAINSGVTMYRIAKEIGLTETAVRKIRDKGEQR